jgi:hypothetical protein
MEHEMDGLVVRMEKKTAYNTSVGKSERKVPLGRSRRRWKIILE